MFTSLFVLFSRLSVHKAKISKQRAPKLQYMVKYQNSYSMPDGQVMGKCFKMTEGVYFDDMALGSCSLLKFETVAIKNVFECLFNYF